MVWSVSRVGGGPVVEGTVRLSLHPRSHSGPEQGLHHRHGSPETAESVSGSWVS